MEFTNQDEISENASFLDHFTTEIMCGSNVKTVFSKNLPPGGAIIGQGVTFVPQRSVKVHARFLQDHTLYLRHFVQNRTRLQTVAVNLRQSGWSMNKM